MAFRRKKGGGSDAAGKVVYIGHGRSLSRRKSRSPERRIFEAELRQNGANRKRYIDAAREQNGGNREGYARALRRQREEAAGRTLGETATETSRTAVVEFPPDDDLPPVGPGPGPESAA